MAHQQAPHVVHECMAYSNNVEHVNSPNHIIETTPTSLVLLQITRRQALTHPAELVRLLFMVPIYAIISCLAYFFWEQALPLTLIRDAYESVILAAFFYLLLEYLAPSPAEQREYFRKVKLDKWMFPFGWVKYRPSDGLYFLQLMKWGILQYCVVRPLCVVIYSPLIHS